jgi:hypothetical protein
MTKPKSLVPMEAPAEPLARAKRLAEKMARVLNDAEVSDAAVAVAFLTSGVVTHFADDPAKGPQIINTIRKLEDRLMAGAFDAADLRLQ